MKISRKEGVNKIRIEHNKTLFWIIIVLIILLIAVIYLIVKNNKDDNIKKTECSVDDDCIPNSCCHATGCMPKENVSVCNVFCSMDCSGPLDCGAGTCGCVKGKCQVVPSK
ncbi:MAG: hypothetical protein PHH54_04705 [Candidatus Nanoarchaeia archaeon]|nr:hypothetical protein [Candidatus Nanoarchaeia archaeon]MDD5741257.1 hypothetical protein [Candidatus Nanoarchaeia archaeon]